MQHVRFDRIRRVGAFVALAALLGVMTLLLSQCTMVGDNITGISLDRSQRADCIQNCKDARQACLEQAAHDCAGTDNDCYEQAAAVCQQQFQECRNNCHKQGRGNAG